MHLLVLLRQRTPSAVLHACGRALVAAGPTLTAGEVSQLQPLVARYPVTRLPLELGFMLDGGPSSSYLASPSGLADVMTCSLPG